MRLLYLSLWHLPTSFASFFHPVPRTASLIPSPALTSAVSSPTTTSSLTTITTPTLIDTETGSRITDPPNLMDLTQGLQQKWHVTTYWSCATIGTYSHCGWHEPVLRGGTEIAAAPARLDARAVRVAVGVVVVGALLG